VTLLIGLWSVVTFACIYDRPFDQWSSFGYEPASAIWNGAYHVLLTSATVHAGIIHLLFNLYWFFVLGIVMERTIGAARYLMFVLTAAIVSSGCQLAASGDAGVGLSGVLYAMFGYMWVARSRLPWFRVIHTSTIAVFLAWLLICIGLTQLAVWNVANVGHASGLLFGIAIGGGFVTKGYRAVARAGTGALLLVAVTSAFWAPWSLDWEMNQALRTLGAKEFLQAEKLYSRLIERDPANPLAWWNRGVARKGLGESNQAETDFAKARAIDPKIDSR